VFSAINYHAWTCLMRWIRAKYKGKHRLGMKNSAAASAAMAGGSPSLLRWYGTEPDTDHEAGKAMLPAPGSVTAARPARNPASLLLGVLGNMVS
jgi:hypothetical protein